MPDKSQTALGISQRRALKSMEKKDDAVAHAIHAGTAAERDTPSSTAPRYETRRQSLLGNSSVLRETQNFDPSELHDNNLNVFLAEHEKVPLPAHKYTPPPKEVFDAAYFAQIGDAEQQHRERIRIDNRLLYKPAPHSFSPFPKQK